MDYTNIQHLPPYQGENTDHIPDTLFCMLQISNGMIETMTHPGTGEVIPVMWVLYSYERIIIESGFSNPTMMWMGLCLRMTAQEIPMC